MESLAKQANINQSGSDVKGENKDWLDVKEAQILKQKLRAHFEIYGNGFDSIDGQVAEAMDEIGITDALLKMNTKNLWKEFTGGCEQALRSFYDFLGIKI